MPQQRAHRAYWEDKRNPGRQVWHVRSVLCLHVRMLCKLTCWSKDTTSDRLQHCYGSSINDNVIPVGIVSHSAMQSDCTPPMSDTCTGLQDTLEDFSNWEFFLAQDADLRRCVEWESHTTLVSDVGESSEPQPPTAQAVQASPAPGSRNRTPTGLPPSGKSSLQIAQNRQVQQRLCAQQKVHKAPVQPSFAAYYETKGASVRLVAGTRISLAS